MQHQVEETTIKRRCHKRCSVKGCTSEGEGMFKFPMDCRCRKWLEACGRPELTALPLGKLKCRTVCILHFERQYILSKKLSLSAVPTLHLPGLAACTMGQKDEQNAMEIAEEEKCQPHCSVGAAKECTALPGSSRGNVLKLLHDSTLERPLKKKIYNAVATLKKEANQCKRRRLELKQHIQKIDHLVQVGVCQVLENLPTPLHNMISAQMRNEGKSIHGRRFSEEEKVLALSIYKQSPKAYRYLSKLFLLPSIETLRKLMSQIPLRAGICDNVFEEIKERSESFSNENSRYAVLIFDELKLSPTWT